MQSAQEAEFERRSRLSNAQLGSVVESAIQRELEDERIAAQLTIDLLQSGQRPGSNSRGANCARRHPRPNDLPKWSATN